MALNFRLPQLTGEQKKNLAAGLFMCCVFTYMYFKFVWNPWSKRLAEDLQKTGEVRAKIQSAQQEARHLEQLEKEMTTLNAQTQDAEKRLPKTQDMPTVFDTVNRLAQRYKVQIISFAPGAISPKTYFYEIAYQISLAGRYHDVGRFLAALSTQERIYNLRDVTFISGGGDTATLLNVNFTLLAYQYKG